MRRLLRSRSHPREDPPARTLKLQFDGGFGQMPLTAHNEFVLRGAVQGSPPVDDIVVEVDGRLYHAARGLERDDPNDRSGFELRLDTGGRERGRHRVRVTARAPRGIETVVEGDVDLRPYENPVYTVEENRAVIADGGTAMWCETPLLNGSAHVTTPLRCEGWAWCRDGLEDVTVFVDGLVSIEAEHGLDRPDLEGALGKEVAARCGFTATLDPSELQPGWHKLTVIASGSSGKSVGVEGWLKCIGSDPAPADKEPVSASLMADRYVPEAHVGYSFEPEHHARYRWAARLASGRRVLDAGSGTGFGTEMLARAGASICCGFDLSLEAVEHARGRAGDVADFVVGDLCDIPYGDDSFELVTCFEAIEHVASPLTVLDELQRVLAPGGIVLVSTPNRGVYPEGNVHHLHEFTSGEFERAVRDRFEHVAVLRQQTHIASLLAGDETFAVADSEKQLSVDMRKVVSASPGEEMYTVAVASDRTIPELAEIAVLGNAIDLAQKIRETEVWRERTRRAEAAAAALRAEARG